jgi:molybdopterin-guanine dinucleotide biosynthesis protein A
MPKGLERVAGERIIDRVAAALRPVTDDLLLVANDPAAAGWLDGTRVQPDIVPNAGGLGGIHAALHAARAPVLIVAWDMPFVPSALLARLRALGEGADVAVPESGSRRGVEPLCAFYAPSCLPAIEQSLADGDRRVIGFHERVRVARLPADEVSAFGDPALLFMNVNTPDDLARAEAHAATAHGGDHRTETQR